PFYDSSSYYNNLNRKKVQKGKEHILFVDDEEEITFMGKRMLESLGYSVSVHTKSLTALEEFTSNPGLYDLLVTDQTMPYLLGTELIRKVRELKPGIKAIIITGYADSISEEMKIMEKIDAVVIKPLILSNFSNLIRKVLDEKNNRKS
ncbi:MAG: response regulator, partial [Bacteroidota bacterium]|nr:response regulator [Bacteroidota bacterium]